VNAPDAPRLAKQFLELGCRFFSSEQWGWVYIKGVIEPWVTHVAQAVEGNAEWKLICAFVGLLWNQRRWIGKVLKKQFHSRETIRAQVAQYKKNQIIGFEFLRA